MSAWRFLAAGLLVGLAVASANADELPTRIFHIGIVAGTPRSSPERVAFEDRLRELGYVEGRNLAIDFVHYDDLDRGAAAVGEMARRRVDVLVIGGQDELIKAAVTAARSVSVVTTAVDSDPLAKGYIASLSHPGGNLTGVVFQQLELTAKRLDLLTQAVSRISRIVLLYDIAGVARRTRNRRRSPSRVLWVENVKATTGLQSTSRPPTHRHLGYPADGTLSQKGRMLRPDRQTLDASEYRQCAGWSRDSPAPAGAGKRFPRSSLVDQEGQVTIPRRT